MRHILFHYIHYTHINILFHSECRERNKTKHQNYFIVTKHDHTYLQSNEIEKENKTEQPFFLISRLKQMAELDFNLRICPVYLHLGKGNSPTREKKNNVKGHFESCSCLCSNISDEI